MTVIVYGTDLSPPVRSVLLLCRAIDLDIELKIVNFTKGEQFKPEFMKINPLHTIPTIVDGDYTLWDSHAVVCYLASKYGKDDSWYPKDLQQRGIVDQRLHFDNSIFFTRLRGLASPVIQRLTTTFPEEKLQLADEALKMFETLLGDNPFFAGQKPTVADCCAITNVTSLIALDPVRYAPSPRVAAWVKRCEEVLPGFKEVNQGMDGLNSLVKNLMNKQ